MFKRVDLTKILPRFLATTIVCPRRDLVRKCQVPLNRPKARLLAQVLRKFSEGTLDAQVCGGRTRGPRAHSDDELGGTHGLLPGPVQVGWPW
jgi:hypothetical protein